jgi:hypothetical protein
VVPRAGLDTEATGKILCLRQGSNADRPVVQTVVRHYTALGHLDNTMKPNLVQRSTILKTLLYGSEIWKITQCNKHRLRKEEIKYTQQQSTFFLTTK